MLIAMQSNSMRDSLKGANYLTIELSELFNMHEVRGSEINGTTFRAYNLF